MLVQHSSILDASADKVWNVLSGEFADSSKWCVGIADSQQVADLNLSSIQAKDGSTGRKVYPPSGEVIAETLTKHSDDDDKKKSLRYGMEGGLPSFVENCSCGWTVEMISETQSKVTVELAGTMNPFPGLLLDPVYTYWIVPRILKDKCESLQHYVETGEPSSTKTEEMMAQVDDKY